MVTTYETLKACKKIDFPDSLLKSLCCTDGKIEIAEYKGAPIFAMDGNGYNHCFSRIYLTYLTQRLLNLHRIPGFEEDVLYSRDPKVKVALSALSEADINLHLEALNTVYTHTQNELKRVLDSSSVLLYRGFREPMNTMISLAVHRAKLQGDEFARVYSNTIDFFAFKPEGHSEGSFVVIEVDIENILIAHQTVNGFSNTDQDVFVINRNPTGFMDIPISCFNVNEPCPVAISDFNRIAEYSRERDHNYIFANMMRMLLPPQPEIYAFEYQPGTYEQLLTRIGKKFDSKFRKQFRWYTWNKKHYKDSYFQ